ncbi:hypothetical protein DFH06DRAFT_1139818 [Mycena polygramma]|nr:hypothetical protein DFH06DRAFT_1139818 [Mycena polygramma]
MCWGIGISGVVRATLTINSDWGWRLPFIIQWVWPIPLIIGAYFAPESPWWLVRQGRHKDAEKSVRRLTDHDLFSEEDAKRSVANMIHTTAIEREIQAGTSYLQCFTGIDLRRTEIAMMVFAIQLLSGENLIDVHHRHRSLLLNFVYNSTLGAVCYVIIVEVGSTRMRAKTIVRLRCAYQIMNIICGIIVPRMPSPTVWNWGRKSGLFSSGSATLSCLYCFLRLPETRGRSYGELDILFANRVPAWRFSKSKADQFGLSDNPTHPDEKVSHDSKTAPIALGYSLLAWSQPYFCTKHTPNSEEARCVRPSRARDLPLDAEELGKSAIAINHFQRRRPRWRQNVEQNSQKYKCR